MVRMGGGNQATKKTTTTKKTSTKKASAKKEAAPVVEKKNYTHLIIEYLAEGVSSVEKMVKQYKMKPSVVRRAAKELHKTHPEKADLFIAWVEKNYPISRGKTEPSVGETRRYSAQQVKNKKTGKPGPVFARVPLGPLGVTRSGDVDITFDVDEIRIRRVKDDAKAKSKGG